MPNKLELAGQRFGKLIVLSEAGQDRFGAYRWLCHCDCGEETIVRGAQLKSGAANSCGCGIAEAASRPRTHGMTHTPLYQRWRAMISRCTLANSAEYHNYGGRGIRICEEWNNFQRFADDMGATFSPELELDRIDVDGPYSPSNCRWATRKEQQRNRRNNHRVSWRGRDLTVYEWAERLGHKPNTLIYRLRRGWPVERALSFNANSAKLLELANPSESDSPPKVAG